MRTLKGGKTSVVKREETVLSLFSRLFSAPNKVLHCEPDTQGGHCKGEVLTGIASRSSSAS